MNKDVLKGAIGVILSQEFGCDVSRSLGVADEIMSIVVGALTTPPSASGSPPAGEAPTPLSVQVKNLETTMQTMVDGLQKQIAAIQSSLPQPVATSGTPTTIPPGTS